MLILNLNMLKNLMHLKVRNANDLKYNILKKYIINLRINLRTTMLQSYNVHFPKKNKKNKIIIILSKVK